jgi:hypothetical protein
VNKNLIVVANPLLTNLDGLAKLTSVASAIRIEKNDALMSLGGLAQVTSVGGSVFVKNNPALTDLSGLEGLGSVDGVLDISDNDGLVDLSALATVGSVSIKLIVKKNQILGDLSGLEGLVSAGGILIHDNATLSSIEALSGLTVVDGDVIITKNESLAQCLVDAWVKVILELGEIQGKVDVKDNNSDCVCEELNGKVHATCP